MSKRGGAFTRDTDEGSIRIVQIRDKEHILPHQEHYLTTFWRITSDQTLEILQKISPIKDFVTPDCILYGYFRANESPNWYEDAATVATIRILNSIEQESFEDYFADFQNVTKIEGLGNLKLNDARSLNRMFKNCRSLKKVDFTNFKFRFKPTVEELFFNCESLKYVVISDDYSINDISANNNMFTNCNSLYHYNIEDPTRASSIHAFYSNTPDPECLGYFLPRKRNVLFTWGINSDTESLVLSEDELPGDISQYSDIGMIEVLIDLLDEEASVLSSLIDAATETLKLN